MHGSAQRLPLEMQPGKIKGIPMIDAVKALRAMGPQVQALIPEELKTYVEVGRYVMAAGWYPAEHFLGLAEVVTRTMPDPGMDRWKFLGCFGGKQVFNGVYAPLIKAGDPGESLARYPEIWPFYHDEGHAKVARTSETSSSIAILSYLTSLDTFCRLQAGHMEELLRVAGATTAQIRVAQTATTSQPALFEARWVI